MDGLETLIKGEEILILGRMGESYMAAYGTADPQGKGNLVDNGNAIIGPEGFPVIICDGSGLSVGNNPYTHVLSEVSKRIRLPLDEFQDSHSEDVLREAHKIMMSGNGHFKGPILNGFVPYFKGNPVGALSTVDMSGEVPQTKYYSLTGLEPGQGTFISTTREGSGDFEISEENPEKVARKLFDYFGGMASVAVANMRGINYDGHVILNRRVG